MASLADDVLYQIFSHFPQKTLIECRLVDKRFSRIATRFAFRHIRLRAATDEHNLVNITQTEALRRFVRELTIETWNEEPLRMHSRDFIRAIAHMRFLAQLTSLHVRFHKDTVTKESRGFRYFILDIIFRSLAGEWPEDHVSLRMGEDLHIQLRRGDYGSLPLLPTALTLRQDNDVEMADLLANLQTLTISNLADFNEPRLTESKAFRKVMASKSLISIKMLVAIKPRGARSTNAHDADKYDFCESLPSTWLRPEIAQNLRVLSLFFDQYWGWAPKMDLRAVNPGNTRESGGLPHLRVLALGHYVFSHQWQVDWIASVAGHANQPHGLEELYLDTCPILLSAHTIEPLDQSSTTHVLEDGSKIEYSNEGYPRKDAITNVAPAGELEVADFDGQLRWRNVIEYWEARMSSLKVLRMGRGAWGERELNAKLATISFYDPIAPAREALPETISDRMMQPIDPFRSCKQLMRWTNHLDYDCPVPPQQLPGGKYGPGFLPYPGIGLSDQVENMFLYMKYDVFYSEQWVKQGPFAPSPSQDECVDRLAQREQDAKAYDRLLRLMRKRKQER
ncbi:hypothetical protein BJ166DRAFT_573771 [Pestalotiopsis sp. NC0098]|nr:hypothetical protein BJ166DRAFT_573771 [Pestalotiopsis sp. NC0098]